MLHENQASYTPDMAALIDTEEEIIADDLSVSLFTARKIIRMREDAVIRNQSLILARVIGLLLQSNNLPATIHALALASGLDQLNGKKSQAEIARELGVTRALISHYVVGIRDILSGKDSNFDCTKYRKANSTRETYKAKATDPFTKAKAAARARLSSTK
jgi:predicted transcriptional regulator